MLGCRPLLRLTGLADGLEPDERRYGDLDGRRFAPPAVGPPLPASDGNSADAAGIVPSEPPARSCFLEQAPDVAASSHPEAAALGAARGRAVARLSRRTSWTRRPPWRRTPPRRRRPGRCRDSP